MKRSYLIILMVLTASLLAACQNTGNTKPNDIAPNTAGNTESSKQTNTEIAGELWGEEGDIGVVLSHGAVYDANSWEQQGKQLAENGMVAFSVEDTSPDNLIAAAKMLKNDYNLDKVSLVGASAGGSTAIDAVTNDSFAFDRVVLLSPAGDAAEITDIPVLVIYSEEEGYETLEKAVENQSDSQIQTLAIPGSAHAQAIFDDREKGNKIMENMIDFLNK